MPKKTGVCMNVGGCTKARNREIQEADISNFICEECSKPLKEKKTTGGGGGSFWKKHNKQIILALCVVGIVAAGAFGLSQCEKTESDIVEAPIEVQQTQPTQPTQPTQQAQQAQQAQQTPPKNPTELNLGYAIYTGPIVNGQAHGIDGEMRVTKHHTFDLKDGKGSTIDVEPGDIIKNCKFKNGKFVSGYLHRKGGSQKHINIGV